MDKTNNSSINYSIKQKILTLVWAAVLPLLMVTVFLLISFLDYSKTYDAIVENLTIANGYNISFKENMNESLYKIIVGHVNFESIDDDKTLSNPYTLINGLRGDASTLLDKVDPSSRIWLQSLLRNLDTLENRINVIKKNIDEGDQYDENILMLNDDIYILTDLIQDDIQYFIYYQTINIERLQTVLSRRVKLFTLIWAGLSVVIVALILILAARMVRNITEPLDELCDATNQIAGGDFKQKSTTNTDDEISVLASSINDMAEHLDELVDHIKEDERKMRYAELRLLQEQINPHFLYNTLDAIVWLIEVERNEEAQNMVMSLSEFFRLVLSKGKEYITIKDEEQHIRSYLEIQQVRYRDILDFNINIDKDIYDYSILKMTLQPIVENSLYHGIKQKRGKGTINVRGYRDGDRIILTVEDDGVGMSEELLENLRKDINRPCKETENGFGLANVNERIHVNFGFEYGLSIDSQINKGTAIRITIPTVVMNTKEDEANE